MCLAPKLAMPAAPPPPPTALSKGAIDARTGQRRKQKAAGGYNSTLLTGAPPAPVTGGKTLLGS